MHGDSIDLMHGDSIDLMHSPTVPFLTHGILETTLVGRGEGGGNGGR